MSSPIEQKNMRSWHALDAEVELAAREAVEYALMEAGALGTETNDREQELLQVTAYFNEAPDRERVRMELAEALDIYNLPSSSVRDMNVREVADRDWLGEWKKGWQPVEVGNRFIIAPPWSEVQDTQGRILVRIEPAMAFGTGTHETTRLCLALLEKYFEGGSFLDVGTGTGILAIAAAKLFPDARIEACDTDPEAIAIARENAGLNVVANVAFREGTVDESTASADCVCANLTADTISQLLPWLLGVTCGRLILSGFLDLQIDYILDRLRQYGIREVVEIKKDVEWIAVVV
ncbi:MAG TPA: 50S ribosomal protein L11 methyltransferase [Pyrinomonadaceae bacterium]|nr:50S ribosomal protein L11 methyltransferase [Pyrinomonadaceae bacterium]